jgi:hypothetical protein
MPIATFLSCGVALTCSRVPDSGSVFAWPHVGRFAGQSSKRRSSSISSQEDQKLRRFCLRARRDSDAGSKSRRVPLVSDGAWGWSSKKPANVANLRPSSFCNQAASRQPPMNNAGDRARRLSEVRTGFVAEKRAWFSRRTGHRRRAEPSECGGRSTRRLRRLTPHGWRLQRASSSIPSLRSGSPGKRSESGK